jgi:hypothetical protein
MAVELDPPDPLEPPLLPQPLLLPHPPTETPQPALAPQPTLMEPAQPALMVVPQETFATAFTVQMAATTLTTHLMRLNKNQPPSVYIISV